MVTQAYKSIGPDNDDKNDNPSNPARENYNLIVIMLDNKFICSRDNIYLQYPDRIRGAESLRSDALEFPGAIPASCLVNPHCPKALHPGLSRFS